MEEEAVELEEEISFPPGMRPAPWLVFPHKICGKDQFFYNLSEPNRTYLRSIPELSYNSYWQSPSHEGWLVILCDVLDDYTNYSNWKRGDCFLWNPISFKTIPLPTMLQWVDDSSLEIFDSVLSLPPSNPNSMVFFLFHTGLLLFCRPGDKHWRTLDLPKRKHNDSAGELFCFKGKVYYTYYNDGEAIIKQLVPDDQSLSIKTLSGSFETPRPPSVLGAGIQHFSYYVESYDELFTVEKHMYGEQVVALQVFRMDFSLMTWEKVKSLGDHVLFLGIFTTASCSAADLGYTSGCVFFIESDDESLYAFDPEDGSISVSLPCPNLPKPWLTPEWVTIPTTARFADWKRIEHIQKRRRTEDVITKAVENKTGIDDNEKGQKNNEGESHLAVTRGILSAVCQECQGELELAGTSGNPVALCKACRSAIPAAKCENSSKNAKTASLSPWLFFSKKDVAIYNFLDPMHNKKYIVDFSELVSGAKIHFSKGGWLLMSECNEIVFFLNPFTRAMIKLPGLPEEYLYYSISFTSSPTSSDCKIVAIALCFNCCKHKVHSFFIVRGESYWKEYTFKNTDIPSKEEFMEFQPCFENLVFYANAFYSLDCDGSIGLFCLEDSFRWKFLAKPKQLSSTIHRSFLVDCDGELLSVYLGPLGKWLRIFRLDFARMMFTEVKSLGKHMLFVSRSSCISAVALDSRMENKIFFPRFHGEGILFYSLDTGRYHSLGGRHCGQDFHNTKEQIHCCWVEPNLKQVTHKELDWLCL